MFDTNEIRESTNKPKVIPFDGRRFAPWPEVTYCEAKENVIPKILMRKLSEFLPNAEGFECHEFRIGTYNAVVNEQFRIPYNNDAMGVVVITTPSFFDTTFKHWLQTQKKDDESLDEFAKRFGSNPIRCFFIEKFDKMKKVNFLEVLLYG